MGSKTFLLLGFAALTPLLISYGDRQWAATQQRPEGSERLAAEVAQLQDRIKKLEGRVDELSKLPDRLKGVESRVDELYRWTLHPSKK